MQAKRKPIIIFVVFIMVVGQLFGEIKSVVEIKAAGKLLIPTAKSEEKPYSGVITIAPAEISIKCHKKIFQPFNEFDTPKQAIIKINTAELEEIQIQENKLYIVAKDSFWKRYRNIFSMVYKNEYKGWLYWSNIQKWALVFVVDNSNCIGAFEDLKKVIGERCLLTKG